MTENPAWSQAMVRLMAASQDSRIELLAALDAGQRTLQLIDLESVNLFFELPQHGFDDLRHTGLPFGDLATDVRRP